MMTQGVLILFGGLFVMLLAGMPLSVCFGLTGFTVIAGFGLGLMSVPINFYSGIAKYPLLALPVFVLAGLLFERAGIATRLVRLASAIVGNRRGSLGLVAILVCMFLGGISGSGPADAAAVATILLPTMTRQGYPPAFSAGLIAAAGSTAILIPPSVAFIIYSVLMPGVSVPALFAAGLLPGILAGVTLMIPTLWFAMRNDWGGEADEAAPKFWPSLREASWGLLAPVIILGGMRSGVFTPTEAAVIAAAYGLFVGTVVYRSLDLGDIWDVLEESAEISAVVLIVVGLVSIFAHAGSTLGAFEVLAEALISVSKNEMTVMILVMAFLLVAGMFMDAISIYLVFIPVLAPVIAVFHWDPVWFGVLMTMNVAIGQFTPPMAINLMITSRIAGIGMETTARWVWWMVLAMGSAMALVIVFPDIAMGLPRALGYK